MKRFAALLVVLLAAMLPRAQAQSTPDDQYLLIYSYMQQADAQNAHGQTGEALDSYRQAQSDLAKFKNAFPEWNPKIVNFRLNYLAERIDEISAKLTPTNPPAARPSTAPTNAPAPAAAPAAATAQLEAQLSALHEQVRQFQTDNATLQAKLKEALAAQPAAVDPRELARAREQIRTLMKENELLKVSQSKTQAAPAVSPPPAAPPAGVDVPSLQRALAEANRRLAEQTARADRLMAENQSLQARVQSLMASADAAEALRAENELLKKQLAEARTVVPIVTPEPAPPVLSSPGDTGRQLAQARAQIAMLQSDAAVVWLEKTALENRVRQLLAAATRAPVAVASNQAENEARIRELEHERNDLLEKLGAANKELYGNKNQGAAARIDALVQQVETLRARVAVDEAQAIPYTPEELALFKPSEPRLAANPEAEKKSVQELPAGSAAMVAEAQRFFADKQYDKAEDAYLQVLRRDENNPLALANLAAIELEQNKLDDAEKHIQAALTQKPNDAYNLSILGYLKFRQEKYDDALDALSRAAKLDPQNPEIENYLGVTLSHKGLRAQAETALRQAVQLDPNYGAAHNNLAVIYLSQQPPLVGLARWHYQKALAAGQPRNPELEKALDEKSAAGKPPADNKTE